MFKIITPAHYQTIAWKNGKGVTTELAINSGATLANFDWRLSIASVVENGGFSDFSGYQRQLILLSGNGIKLTHDARQVDQLTLPLSMAVFDGACHTVGELIGGPVEDFNVMTKQKTFKADVKTFPQQHSINYSATWISFIYATKQSIQIKYNLENIELAKGHLFQASSETVSNFQVTGSDFIVVNIQPLA